MNKFWHIKVMLTEPKFHYSFLRVSLMLALLFGFAFVGYRIFEISQGCSSPPCPSIWEEGFTIELISLVVTVFFGLVLVSLDNYLDNKLSNYRHLKVDWTFPVLSYAFLLWAINQDIALFFKAFLDEDNISNPGHLIAAFISSANSLFLIGSIRYFNFNKALREGDQIRNNHSGIIRFFIKSPARIGWTYIIVITLTICIYYVFPPNKAEDWITWLYIPDLFYSAIVVIILLRSLEKILEERDFKGFKWIFRSALYLMILYQMIYPWNPENLDPTSSFANGILQTKQILNPIGLIYKIILGAAFISLALSFALKVGEITERYLSPPENFFRNFFTKLGNNNGLHKSNPLGIEQALGAIATFVGFSRDEFEKTFNIRRIATSDGSYDFKYDDDNAIIQTLKDCFNEGKISLLLIALIAMAAFNDTRRKKEWRKTKTFLDFLEVNNKNNTFKNVDRLKGSYINPNKTVNRNFSDVKFIIREIWNLFTEIGYSDKPPNKCLLHNIKYTHKKDEKTTRELTFEIEGIAITDLYKKINEVKTNETFPHRHIVSKSLIRLYEMLNQPYFAYSGEDDESKGYYTISNQVSLFDFYNLNDSTLCIKFTGKNSL